jgi:hypothetical protein
MVQGKNKGHWYETDTAKELLKHRVKIEQSCLNCHIKKFSSTHEQCPKCGEKLQLTAGSGIQEDIIFKHKGKNFSLELKNNAGDPDWGQCALRPQLDVNGNWIWDWSDASKEKKSKLIEYYNQFKCLDGSRGLLEYLNKKKIIPNKYRIPNDKITFEMRKEDQRNFEDKKHKISAEAFARFHRRKSDYVQIGGKYGLFHINNDSANLGTEKFDAIFTLRFRAKVTNSHFPICPNCGKQRTPGTDAKCKQCQIKLTLPKGEGESCDVCKKDPKLNHGPIPYEKYVHRDDHIEFVLTILYPKIISKSKFNIWESAEQSFPPIES